MDLEDLGSPWRQHLRLALLRALGNPEECRGGKGHESLLTDLMNGLLIQADRADVRQELLWLHGHNLVAAEIVGADDANKALAAQILADGVEVAAGRRVCAGVKQPSMVASLKSVAELLSEAAALKPVGVRKG